MAGLSNILMIVASTSLLLVLAVVIVRRKLHLQYPFFSLYITYDILRALFLLCVIGNYKLYFFGYWIADAFSLVLVLLALHEAFHEAFEGFYVFPWFRLLFPSVVALLVFFATRQAMANPASLAPRFMYVIFAIDNSVGYVQAGIFMIFLALLVALNVRWRRYPYGIALGFAVGSIGTWISYALFWEFGAKYAGIARHAMPLAYCGSLIVWLWTFRKESEAVAVSGKVHSLAPEQLLDEVRDHIRINKKVLGQGINEEIK